MTDLFFGVSDDFRVPEFQERKVIDEIKMIMSAFDCVLSDHSGIYCSSDITTGKRFYELLIRHGVHSADQLCKNCGPTKYEQIIADLVKSNVAVGSEFREALRQRDLTDVVNPGPFFAPGFDQEHYLYLWESIIIKKIREIWFNRDWEYSNGCTFEYAIAAKKKIARFDHNGERLEIDSAVAKIEAAIKELKRLGFLADKLQRNLGLIKGLR